MALQDSDLLVIHRPGADAGKLYHCTVGDFNDDANPDFATTEETIEGTSETLAITPKGMKETLNGSSYTIDAGAVVIDENNWDYITQ